MYLVVCYDIVENRRRNRILKKLREHLSHVQKSVFEGELSDERVGGLRQMLLEEMDPVVDTVRIYHQCARCVPAIEVLGTGVYVDQEESDQVV